MLLIKWNACLLYIFVHLFGFMFIQLSGVRAPNLFPPQSGLCLFHLTIFFALNLILYFCAFIWLYVYPTYVYLDLYLSNLLV